MTNDDAKRIYNDALATVNSDPARALALLDELDAARPNSRQVNYQRGLCLVRLGKLAEAQECAARLKGKLEDDKLGELEAAIGAKRASLQAAASDTSAAPATPLAASAGEENVLLVESTFPVSTSEAMVTGHMTSGVFHLGDMVTITTDSGMPLLAPIRRIGTADAPLKLVREGQRAVVLLEVEPHHIRPGGRIVSRGMEEAYAKTMVVSSASQADTGPEELSTEILKIERDIKAGNFSAAHDALYEYLSSHPNSKTAHRLAARVHLEGPDGIKDAAKALTLIRKAYELGGSEDPAVMDTLAFAMAETGEADHGLRFLERQYSLLSDPRAASAMAKRITDFRERYTLGHVWEFSDTYGDVVFETKDLGEAARALKNNTVPRNGKVRRDRVGEWREIETTLSNEHPDIAALFGKPAAKGSSTGVYLLVGILIAAAIAAALIFLR